MQLGWLRFGFVSMVAGASLANAQGLGAAKDPKQPIQIETDPRATVSQPAGGALTVHETPVDMKVPPAPDAMVPPTVAPQATMPADAKSGSFGLGAGLMGLHFTFGFPHILDYGIDWRLSDQLGFAVDFGKTSVDLLSVAASLRNFDARVRFFPFSGSFNVAAAFGHQKFDVSLTKTYEVTGYGDQEATLKMNVSSTYVVPMFGWAWGAETAGFNWGVDFGVLVPLSPTADYNITMDNDAAEAALKETDDYKDQKAKIDKAAKWLGKQSIPYSAFFRLGYLF